MRPPCRMQPVSYPQPRLFGPRTYIRNFFARLSDRSFWLFPIASGAITMDPVTAGGDTAPSWGGYPLSSIMHRHTFFPLMYCSLLLSLGRCDNMSGLPKYFFSLDLLYSTMVTCPACLSTFFLWICCTQRWLHVRLAYIFSLDLLYSTMVTCPACSTFFL